MIICVLLAYIYCIFFGYFYWFLIFVFSVLAKRLAGKSIAEVTYFVSGGT